LCGDDGRDSGCEVTLQNMTFRRWFSLSSLLCGAVIVDGCSLSPQADPASSGGCGGRCADGGVTDAAPDHTLDVGTPDQQPPVDSSPFNPLCGQGCNPDDTRACGDAMAQLPSVENGGDAGLEASGGDAGDAASVPEAGPTDSGGRRDAAPAAFGCQVRRAGSGRAASCEPSGAGEANAPCVSSADCAPGHACVGDAKAALCRPYCCNGSEGGDGSDRDSGASSCGQGDYCAVRPLRDDSDSAEPLSVPVCVPAEKCLLSEPYPCPPSGVCTCPEGTACTVVRNDGTTGCLEPGVGVQGEPCSSSGRCAAGHLCSRGIDRCLKLCVTTASKPCGSGACQSGGGLPENWGVCVGMMDAGSNRP
jgi:hypothetical protein